MLSKWFKILCTTQSLKSAYSVLKNPIDVCSFTRCVRMQALLTETGIFCLLHFSDWLRKSKKAIDLKFVATVCNVNAVQASSGLPGRKWHMHTHKTAQTKEMSAWFKCLYAQIITVDSFAKTFEPQWWSNIRKRNAVLRCQRQGQA